MDFGKCVFKDCKMPAGVCIDHEGKPLAVCGKHYRRLSELHARAIIEEIFSVRSKAESSA